MHGVHWHIGSWAGVGLEHLEDHIVVMAAEGSAKSRRGVATGR
jgi:hypothetical protein